MNTQDKSLAYDIKTFAILHKKILSDSTKAALEIDYNFDELQDYYLSTLCDGNIHDMSFIRKPLSITNCYFEASGLNHAITIG